MVNELLVQYSVLSRSLNEECTKYKNVVAFQKNQIQELEEKLEDYKVMYNAAMDELSDQDDYIKGLEDDNKRLEEKYTELLEKRTWNNWQKVKENMFNCGESK